MPPLSAIRAEPIADLAAQLRFAPREALARHIASAEGLSLEIDAGQTYPEDWLMFRLTGYRPDLDAPRMVLGDVLLSDLSALVERLSDHAGQTIADLGDGVLEPDDVAARWGVSRKTVDRYRKRGLVARRVVTPTGTRRLAFTRASVEGFERREAGLLERARSFSRIPEELDARIIRRAARYQRRFGCSLNEAASRLAPRFARSKQGIRHLLQRHDARAAARLKQGVGDGPIFSTPGPPGLRDRRMILRAIRRGIEPAEIGQRTGRSKASILRAFNEHRAALLRSLDLGVPPDGSRGDEKALLPGPVRSGLLVRAETGVAPFLDLARERHTPIGVEETARAAAYQHLRHAAGARIASLNTTTASATEIDAIETMLRWAARLKASLMSTQFNLLVATLEGHLGTPLDTLEPGRLVRLLTEAIDAVGDAVDRYDPRHGGRLAAPAGLAITRIATACARAGPSGEAPAGRATRRLPIGASMPDWTRCVSPWQAWLEPDPRVGGVLDTLDPRSRLVLIHRHGFDGGPPETLEQIGRRLGSRHMHAAASERRAVRGALRAARAGVGPG